MAEVAVAGETASSQPVKPRPEGESASLSFSPCSLCEALGSGFLPLVLAQVLRGSISPSSLRNDNADRFAKLASRMAVGNT
jgi:hypothetical protein